MRTTANDSYVRLNTQKLIELRNRYKWSTAYVATQLGYANGGVYQNIEKNRQRTVKYSMAKKMAKLYKCKLYDIVLKPEVAAGSPSKKEKAVAATRDVMSSVSIKSLPLEMILVDSAGKKMKLTLASA